MKIASLFEKDIYIEDEALTDETKNAIESYNKTLKGLFVKKNTIKIKVSDIVYFPYMAKLSSVKN